MSDLLKQSITHNALLTLNQRHLKSPSDTSFIIAVNDEVIEETITPQQQQQPQKTNNEDNDSFNVSSSPLRTRIRSKSLNILGGSGSSSTRAMFEAESPLFEQPLHQNSFSLFPPSNLFDPEDGTGTTELVIPHRFRRQDLTLSSNLIPDYDNEDKVSIVSLNYDSDDNREQFEAKVQSDFLKKVDMPSFGGTPGDTELDAAMDKLSKLFSESNVPDDDLLAETENRILNAIDKKEFKYTKGLSLTDYLPRSILGKGRRIASPTPTMLSPKQQRTDLSKPSVFNSLYSPVSHRGSPRFRDSTAVAYENNINFDQELNDPLWNSIAPDLRSIHQKQIDNNVFNDVVYTENYETESLENTDEILQAEREQLALDILGDTKIDLESQQYVK
jgi:hypothetical protein